MIKRLTMAFSLALIGLMATPVLANAADLLQGVDCSKAGQSAVCQSGSGSNNPVVDLIIHITNIIAFAAGIAAVIIIIIGAIRFVTSGSDTSKGGRVDEDVVNARRSIVGALIGLAIIVLARTLIVFFVNKLKG